MKICVMPVLVAVAFGNALQRAGDIAIGLPCGRPIGIVIQP